MNTQIALVGTIFVTFLWGSWFQTVKHTGNFPVHAFISMMYAVSVVIVWGAIGFLGAEMVPHGVLNEMTGNRPLALLVFACGLVFGVAMQLQLTVVKRIGLILSTSVSATCSILGGTTVSMMFAGIPEGVSIVILVTAAVLLILAAILCQLAGSRRDREAGRLEEQSSRAKDVLFLVFINLVLMSSYPLATSMGLRSPLRPEGFASLTCMGLLVAGACIGSSAFTFLSWKKEENWRKRKEVPMARLLFLAMLAAFCHFGGNVLHAVFAPVVSVAIATVMGNSYHCWSYIWGLVYGEFKGASGKTCLMLGSGILMFLAGVVLLSLEIV